MGGLAGGLFAIFEAVGFVFLLILIGPSRAERWQLRNHKVGIGGLLFGGIVGAAFWWRFGPRLNSSYSSDEIAIAAVIGAGASFILGLILIGYVGSIENEKREEERVRKRREERIEKGLDPDKACFIATAVFGSADAPEVLRLRAWRDRTLSPHPVGRTLVRGYYRLSPPLAQAIGRSRVLKVILSLLVRKLIALMRGIRAI